MDGEIVDILCDYLELDSDHVFQVQSPLDLSFVFEIQDTLRKVPELFYEKRIPQRSAQFKEDESIFPQLKEQDKLTFLILTEKYDTISRISQEKRQMMKMLFLLR